MSNEEVSSLTTQFNILFTHPPVEVSAIIRTSSLSACTEALAASLLSSAQANPVSIDVLIQSLAHDLLATEDLHFTDDEAGWTDAPFNKVFRITLGDFLANALQHSKPKQTDVSPKNTVLSSALFSGSAIQNNLMSSPTIQSFAERGLQFPEAKCLTEQSGEVMAIGTCLLLLVAGKVLLDEWMVADTDRLEKIIKALEMLKEEQVIRHLSAVDLLERTIAEAKGGFATATPAADAWHLLFPGK